MITSVANASVELPRRGRISPVRQFFNDPKARIGFAIFAFFVLIALFAPLITPYNPQSTLFIPLQAPNARHWLGTTGNGQDVLAQFVYGARTSLTVGILAGLTATAIAIVMGMLPAYRGGTFDLVVSTFTNIILVVPGLPLLLVIGAYIHQTGSLVIAIVIGMTGWAWQARVLRSQTLSLVSRDYVVAARLAGAPDRHIIFREILPNMLSLVVAGLMYSCLYGILAEASLEFLGLGNINATSWGTMLYWATQGAALLNGAWWWFVPPGLSIALVGMGFSLMNFAVDTLANPRLRESS